MDDKFKEAFAFGKADAFRSIHGGLGGATPKPVKEITKNDLKLPFNVWRAINLERGPARTLGKKDKLEELGECVFCSGGSFFCNSFSLVVVSRSH